MNTTKTPRLTTRPLPMFAVPMKSVTSAPDRRQNPKLSNKSDGKHDALNPSKNDAGVVANTSQSPPAVPKAMSQGRASLQNLKDLSRIASEHLSEVKQDPVDIEGSIVGTKPVLGEPTREQLEKKWTEAPENFTAKAAIWPRRLFIERFYPLEPRDVWKVISFWARPEDTSYTREIEKAAEALGLVHVVLGSFWYVGLTEADVLKQLEELVEAMKEGDEQTLAHEAVVFKKQQQKTAADIKERQEKAIVDFEELQGELVAAKKKRQEFVMAQCNKDFDSDEIQVGKFIQKWWMVDFKYGQKKAMTEFKKLQEEAWTEFKKGERWERADFEKKQNGERVEMRQLRDQQMAESKKQIKERKQESKSA